MIVYGVLGLLELPLSAYGLWMECCNEPRPVATGCTLCEVISSILGLVNTSWNIVGSVLVFPYDDCSATTDNSLCQGSYRSVYLLAFVVVIYGLVSNVLVCLYRVALCIRWCKARQARAGYTEVQADQGTH